MATKIIYGLVDFNGDKIQGEGFQSTLVEQGIYSIDFSEDFSNIPSVTASIFINAGLFTIADRGIIIKIPHNGQCLVYLSQNGQLTSHSFSFIAIGEE